MNNLVTDFESYPECLGSNFSHYFVRDYKFFQETVELEEDEAFGEEPQRNNTFTKSAMQPFFSWPEFKHWNGFVKFDEQGKLTRVWIVVAYHGQQLGDNVYRKGILER
ncbi:unnamed protein product [Strongylus vulgaris]|uniref:Uncharacterized protein n=1 Tax=Strongylus vulgaris TaxID=40348 RepID=A0A3P7KC79_STRVU|nr:unnamed protein product [Strongylus vulgaris]